MAELEKVIKGIESCKHGKCDYRCPYASVNVGCRYELMGDALELLKEQDKQKKQIMKAVWEVLHEGVSTDTVADQDWVYEQIRNRVDKMY